MNERFNLKKLGLIVIPVALLAVTAFLFVLASPFIFGVNDAGYRTVVQWPNGKLFVKFDQGWYVQAFGKTTEYSDYMTYDFSSLDAKGQATIDTNGIAVRYRDGGTGTIHGKARYGLPSDEESMLRLHKAFKTHRGVASKLVLPVTEQAMNMTAGLLTSEGAYAEQRGTFIKWATAQVKNGIYVTELEQEIATDEVGNTVTKNIPVISLNDKMQPMHEPSDLREYGITATLQVTDWNFEAKTLDQIASKRKATMAIITAKANAEKAKQDAITIEEEGKANVMKAKYEMEIEKQKAVVDAERQKEVAEINAMQKVEVAAQARLEAEQLKLKEVEIKQANILRGEGESEYKRLVMEADGALAQKLATYERVMEAWAGAVAQQKWVPEVQMGSTDSGVNGSSPAQDLISMFSVKTAQDMALDLSIKAQAKK